VWFSKRPKKLNLALQGGGAHGAFTWGVLDQLLLDEQIEFSGISGTSAGALNAIAVAHGLASGGRKVARDTLKAIWSEVEGARVPDFLRLNPLLSSFARSASPVGVFSPYSFNPLGFDPLRQLLERDIDFDAIRANALPELVIAATDVATGQARLFKGPEITVDVVLASACLPTLHHAVTINGRAYWDGGFSANPDMLELATRGRAEDTLLVLLNPAESQQVPRTASAIEARVSLLTFNQPLLRDVDAIAQAKDARLGWWAPRKSHISRLQRHRFHLIAAGEHTASLDAETKVVPDREVLQQLYFAGVGEAEKWLVRCKASIGKRGTVNLQDHFRKSPFVTHALRDAEDTLSAETLAKSA